MHLLEKEPDNRYQSAEGLIYDLERLDDASVQAGGGHDFPVRLLRPSRLVGRDDEVEACGRRSWRRSRAGAVGYWSAGRRAWARRCWSTNCDPWLPTRVGGSSPVSSISTGATWRPTRSSRHYGRWVGCCWPSPKTLWPTFVSGYWQPPGRTPACWPLPCRSSCAAGDTRDAGDPLTAQARAQRTAVQVLGAIASPTRPVVVFLDDLQWAGRTPLGVVDLVLSEEPIEGLLLVGAYRDTDVAATQLLAGMVPRWRDQPGVRHLRLDNLPPSSVVAMAADMLQMRRLPRRPWPGSSVTHVGQSVRGGRVAEWAARAGCADRDGGRVVLG